ncbi:MAG: sigma 54-interacting transcriptional regulator [Snowella sp.]|nr:sigma 54-interacting transcriptional regulator [Snowella sp.]
MISTDLTNWLKERTELSLLGRSVIDEIVPHLQPYNLTANQVLVTEKEDPHGLYLLESGHLERLSQKLGLLPGSAINLRALLLNQPVYETVVALNDCQLWFLDAKIFRDLIQKYPQVIQAFSQYLAAEVEELVSQLMFEQERQIVLRPYLVPKARRAIMGKSRYAVKLRSQIKEAFESREPVLIFGEPGLEKDNTAALIHFHSHEYEKEPLVKVNCATLQVNGADLFGRKGQKMGLLEALANGTLILNNLQELPTALRPAIAELIQDGTYRPVTQASDEAAEPKQSHARIIAIAETTIAGLNNLFPIQIKVPPLRLRKADIEDYINYYISLACRTKGLAPVPVTTEALRRLQAYDFPNNLRELSNLVDRAMTQLQGSAEITEDILWPSQSKKKQFRLNLLNAYPSFRYFLRSDWWPDKLNYGFTAIIYPIIVAILFLGPQQRSENFALNLFWAWWWPLVLISFPFVGRLWCAVCPFMIYGEITQKLSLWLFPRQLKKWPRQTAEKWGGWFLFALFTIILLWEELWDLPDTAYLSAWLLLIITGGAMICSAIFERRFWCRYLCPIGGMNGMFAKLSMTELRAQQGTCSAECSTYQCYKGGPKKGEGQETLGCPLYSHPAQLEDNRDCVLCMTCLKACPHRSVEVNLRPPGIELWTTHIPRPYEVALLFLLLNNIFLRRLPEINLEWGLHLNFDNFSLHSVAAILALSLPTLIPLIAHQLIRQISTGSHTKFLKLSYGYLPLVLAGNLAHYLRLGLGEAGTIIPLTLATFGLSGENLPVVIAHPAVIAFLQASTLLFGVLTSFLVTQKIARQPIKLLLPQHLSIIGLATLMWIVIVGY